MGAEKTVGPGRRARAVTITVAEHGDLDEATVEMLIDCERGGVRTVLWVESEADLESPLVGLATHLAAEDADLHARCAERIGQERVLLVVDPREAERRAAAEVLPPGDRGSLGRPQKLLRRSRRTVRRLARRALGAARVLGGRAGSR